MAENYATCRETYATLCVYHEKLDPDAVTHLLNLQPTSCHRQDDVLDPQARRSRHAKTGGWFLTSRGATESRDLRGHLDWLLAQLRRRSGELAALREQGCETIVSCYWRSAYGHGGPILGPEMMREFGELGVELWFDIYFARVPQE